MTRCMAMDLAADNIRVNSVCPGVVWTQIVKHRRRRWVSTARPPISIRSGPAPS